MSTQTHTLSQIEALSDEGRDALTAEIGAIFSGPRVRPVPMDTRREDWLHTDALLRKRELRNRLIRWGL